MVTSPWQHVSNFLSIRKVQRETRQDEVNNASSVQDATPTSSVQDATHTQRTRRRNNKNLRVYVADRKDSAQPGSCVRHRQK